MRTDIFNGDKLLDVDLETSRKTFGGLKGKQCIVLTEGKLLEEFKQFYSRVDGSPTCLKIFNIPLEGKLTDYYWGTPWRHYSKERTEEIGRISNLFESTVIQNIFAMDNYAPRIFSLALIEQKGKQYPVQFQEFITGEQDDYPDKGKLWKEKIKYLSLRYGIELAHTDLFAPHDFIGDILLDFQGFRFGKGFEESMKNVYRAGLHGKIYYQRIEQLGLNKGPRHTEDRTGYLKLADLDLKGKRVLDLGCAGGAFTRSAIDLGASRADGIDKDTSVKAAKFMNNYLGYFNNDYSETDLKSVYWSVEEYDVVFYISVFLQIGIPKQLEKAKMMVIEHNGYEERGHDKLGKPWTDWFSKIEFVGRAKDHGNKAIYHLWK